MMKQFLVVGIAIICLQTTAGAQQNNPYNQRGVDYFTSLEIISKDFKEGKVAEFTEESIAHYSSVLPLQGTTTSEMASTIYKKLKDTKTNLSNELTKTALGSIGKQTVLNVVFKHKQMSVSDYHSYLESQCNIIRSSQIPDSDKEFVLTMIAIAYNFQPNSPFARNDDCFASGPDGSGPASCILFGAALGGTIGGWICGLPCGLGGAIIGGVIGALS